jgi:hypothetical protein
MSQTLECPRCHLQVENRSMGRTPQQCPACSTPLVQAPTAREADVRKYLYRHHLIPLNPRLGGKKIAAR